MTRRLIWAMTLLAGLVAVTLAVPLASVTSGEVRATFIEDLTNETLATVSVLEAADRSAWQGAVVDIAASTGARVVVVDERGLLVADSDESALGRPFDRPEISQALAGHVTSDVRRSTTLGTDLRFVAAPVVRERTVIAAVRLTMPEGQVDAVVRRTQVALVVFVVAVLCAAAGIAWLIGRSVGAPLERLAAVAASQTHGPREVIAVASALNATAARLQGIIERTERVAAEASHHLRTPLTGIRLRLEAIEETTDQEQVRADAVAATAEVDRLTHRITQVLDLAKADAGAGALQAVDAAAIVDARVDAARIIADEAGIALQCRAPESATVEFTSGGLARVVDELLGNALTYARTRVDVAVDVDERDAVVVLRVADDGPGVTQAELETIFTRFQRGAQAVPGGTGLGLSLVRESVRAVGGDAFADRSTLGGLSVVVRWPMAASAD